jgi:pyruvate-formate lyase-activating enzyme
MKILCLGNNTELTDQQCRDIALSQKKHHWGLITNLGGGCENWKNPGFYHSSIYDLPVHEIKRLADEFDQILILPQGREFYPDSSGFYQTIKLGIELEKYTTVIFVDPNLRDQNVFWENLVKSNKSFCIFPFIELLVQNEHTTVCCRSSKPVIKFVDLKDYNTDPRYQNIRQNMIDGNRLNEYCSSCYKLENLGLISSRQQETVDWADRLELNDLQDLLKIKHPLYYEVRASNVCNLQCRMCLPSNSHLIQQEYFQLGISTGLDVKKYLNFDFVNLDQVQKLYVSGGEPTIQVEFYDFLQRCIDQGKTSFEIMVNTNGTRINQKFKNLVSSFSNFQFTVSVDGFDRVNHYIRWPSDWNTITKNVDWMRSQHQTTINVTVSIFNITRLSDLLEFISDCWSDTRLHLQLASSPGNIMSALNHPRKDLVLKDLKKITDYRHYHDHGVANFIDSLINYYQSSYTLDQVALAEFYRFNDRLDQSRGVHLGDFLPELDSCRLSTPRPVDH